MNTTNRTLELKQVREGERRFVIETFLTFFLSFYKVPDEYYELDFGIEISEGRGKRD